MRVIAFANQKGGVAKTTTTHTLGVCLARLGRTVALVDLDPQGCLTFSCGIDPDTLTKSVRGVLERSEKIRDVQVELAEFDLVPATIDLAQTERSLAADPHGDFALRDALSGAFADETVVLIDCPPTLGMLTINALTAADEVVVPLQAEALAHRGVAQLLDTINEVRRLTNPSLTVRGVVATMYDARIRHSRDVLDDIPTRFGLAVLEPPIPKSIRFAEAPLRGLTILDHAPKSPGAQAYEALATELMRARP